MNILAGLYKKEDQALTAYHALLAAGFLEKDLSMLVRKSIKPLDFPKRASVRDVAISAAVTALLFGLMGLLLVLMKSFGVIKLPGLLPNLEPGNVRMTLILGITMFIGGALTGMLIGAAIRLILSQDKAKITALGVRRGGLLLTVNIDPTQQATAKKVLIENGAVDVENLSELWDQEIWSRYKTVKKP
ncbi:MAG TPA: hypothetical protein VK856_08320 [Anaerolineaceae bacterium]|nr:hypothetical protein [Anaerolineaceae bacterium]